MIISKPFDAKTFHQLPNRIFCLHIYNQETKDSCYKSFLELAAEDRFSNVIFHPLELKEDGESNSNLILSELGIHLQSVPATVICKGSQVLAIQDEFDQLMIIFDELQRIEETHPKMKSLEFGLYHPYCVIVNGCCEIEEFREKEPSKSIFSRLASLGLDSLAVDCGGSSVELMEGDVFRQGKLEKAAFEKLSDAELEEMKNFNLTDWLKTLVNAAPVVLFMKGSPEEAKCGFSRQMIQILREVGFEFPMITFDILRDERVRSGLKIFSNWPTYPQLYVEGELIGGLDIARELAQQGQLREILKKFSSGNAC